MSDKDQFRYVQHVNGTYVMEVDPVKRACTENRQIFLLLADGTTLNPVHDFAGDPTEIETIVVEHFRF